MTLTRRDFLATSAAATALASLPARADEPAPAAPGRLKQSVCRWCYSGVELNELCRRAKEIGLQSVELLSEDEWHIPAQHGLTCAVGNGPSSITGGYNRPENYVRFNKVMERLIPKAAEDGIPNLIVFSGNRSLLGTGRTDEGGLDHCARGLSEITPLAEKHNITLVMELLNSKIDHKKYMCDRTPWGVRLVEKVASPRFKLLYDIYHMQIMEGDIIRTIRDHHQHIAHYHTAGVPGRNEIDDTQELNYPAICRAIADTGFTGYLGQEFIPRNDDPFASLRQAVQLCSV
jgi:hydroxypyruvate isomerase